MDSSTPFAYSCNLGSTLPSGSLSNTATIAWPGQFLDNGDFLAADSATVTVPNISFTATNVDDCVTVTDTNVVGNLGTACVGDAPTKGTGPDTFPSPKSNTNSKTVAAPPVGTCANFDNTATFTTNTLGTTGSASQTVTVCHYRSALTPGYWKNHAANSTKNESGKPRPTAIAGWNGAPLT